MANMHPADVSLSKLLKSQGHYHSWETFCKIVVLTQLYMVHRDSRVERDSWLTWNINHGSWVEFFMWQVHDLHSMHGACLQEAGNAMQQTPDRINKLLHSNPYLKHGNNESWFTSYYRRRWTFYWYKVITKYSNAVPLTVRYLLINALITWLDVYPDIGM